MSDLPITRVVLHKHGVAHVERAGVVTGDRVELRFPRDAMDDVLKSLVVLDTAGGRVLGVDVEAADDRAAAQASARIHLGDDDSLVSLLRSLRGHVVRLQRSSGGSLEGVVLGVDTPEPVQGGEPPRVSIVVPGDAVRPIALDDVLAVELRDGAATDLQWVLQAARGDDEHRTAVVRLAGERHDLRVSYLVPAPAWRVSYRVALGAADEVLLQAWGIVDNELGDDLDAVALELVAGQPVSFRYRLYEGRTPERPYLEDEDRVVTASPAPPGAVRYAMAPMAAMMRDETASMTVSTMMASSFGEAAQGDDRGALFAYTVAGPVTVGRGQSALVPLASATVPGRRRLLYVAGTVPPHPRAAVTLRNTTGLTLERGPVTVLEAGSYAGEAVVPFSPVGADVSLAFAVELGIDVDERESSEQRVVGVRIDDVGLLVECHEIHRRTFTLTSRLPDATAVVVEVPRAPGTDLVGTPGPDETPPGAACWTVAVPAAGSASLEVAERWLVARRQSVEHVDADELDRWRSGLPLDPPTSAALAALATARRHLDDLDERLEELDAERDRLHERQGRLTAALEPLGGDGDEGALRRRYVGELAGLEDRLDVVDADEEAARAERASIVARLRTPVAAPVDPPA